MYEYIQEIINNPIPSLLVVGNLILIESLLSIDNAAVLATMVMDLPENKREKALKYFIIGAYVFRGLAMLFAAFIIQIWWLKPLGGLYLVYLAIDYYLSKRKNQEIPDAVNHKEKSWFYKATVGKLGVFWTTVCLIEIMDMAFSIDNVFAAVAFSKNIVLVCLGVFIGILAMRFVANYFVKLLHKFPFLETAAYLVILILGLKLTFSVYEHKFPESAITKLLTSEMFDAILSITTVLIFVVPVLFSLLRKK